MLQHLQGLVEHMKWANLRILDRLNDNPLEGVSRIYAHILITEAIYLERIAGLDPWPQNFWKSLSSNEMREILHVNYERYEGLVRSCSEKDLDEIISYRTSQGVRQHNTLPEMVTHVSLHGQHHRGQIAQLYRLEGLDPPITDFIVFTRV